MGFCITCNLDIFWMSWIFSLFAECSPVRPAGGDHLAATFPFHISAMLQLLVFNLPHEKCLEHSEAASSSTD